jgi:propanol-preferring alcohol dehydrogenase
MKAAILANKNQFSVSEIPDPSVEGWAVVQIKASGVCGTELHILDGMIEPPHFPFVLGHEAAGVVVSVPSGSDISIGDRVAVFNMIGCGKCEWCRSGNAQVCTDPVGQLGFTLDGTFSDLIAVPVENLIPLPEQVSFADAALFSCGGMTAVHAIRLGQVSLGDTVVVNGVGGVGLMAIQVAYDAGARVIAIADSAEKASLASEAGAFHTVVLDDEGYDAVPAQVKLVTSGFGATHFIELVGTSASMLAGIRSLGRRGAFVSIGYTKEEIAVHPIELILSEIRLLSSVAASRRDLETAIRLAAEGRLTTVIDTRYPLAEVQVALDRLRARQVSGRNVLVWE